MVCLRDYFFSNKDILEKHFETLAVLGICRPRKKKTVLRVMVLTSRERAQGSPAVQGVIEGGSACRYFRELPGSQSERQLGGIPGKRGAAAGPNCRAFQQSKR